MSYMDIVTLVKTEGTYSEEDFKGTLATEEYIKEFKKLMAIDEGYGIRLSNTEDAKQFLSWCPLFEVLPAEMFEDLFYVEKNGYVIEGVPARLVFLLDKAMKTYPVNKALSLIDRRLLKRFEGGKHLLKGISIQNVISTINNMDANIISEGIPIVSNAGTYEVYLEKEDAILLLPEELGKGLHSNPEQISELVVDDVKGVMLMDVPLVSLLDGRSYIDMFDLRNVF